MARTHYETLGVHQASTPAEIRSAYRKIVLRHHPDRSGDPGSPEIFLKATEAYETLSDADRRVEYDRWLRNEEQRRRAPQKPVQTPAPRASPSSQPKTPPRPSATLAADVTRAALLFSRGRIQEAEKLARNILERDSRQAIAYGILGDIARSRGNLVEASKMYAYAAQMDPRNPTYQQRHEELLRSTKVSTSTVRIGQNEKPTVVAPMFGAAMVLLGCIYIALANEAPLLPMFDLISTWTLGLVVMLFLGGVAVGSTLSLGGLVDRFSSIATTALGKASPTVALGVVAIVSFWAAAALYGVIGISQKAFNYSTSRVVAATSAVAILMTIASSGSPVLDPLQVFLWSGNLLYIGSLCGWMVADAFKR